MKYDEREPSLRIDIYDKMFALYVECKKGNHISDTIFVRALALALQTVDRDAREDERAKLEKENEPLEVLCPRCGYDKDY